MEEMQAFTRQYEELARRVENIDEVGVLELKRVFEELRSLDSRAGISIENFGNNPENDPNAKLAALKVWDELKENIRVTLVEIDKHYDARKAVLLAKWEEYRRIKDYKRQSLRRINEFRFELDKHKALLNHINDSFAKDSMEDNIKDDEKHIKKEEEFCDKYDKQMAKLEEDCKVLLRGGKLPEVDLVDEEDIADDIEHGIAPTITEKEEPAPKKKDEPKPKKQKEEKTAKEEAIIAPAKISVKRDEDEDKDLNKAIIPKKELSEDKIVDKNDKTRRTLPPKFVDLENELEEENDEDLVLPLPPVEKEDSDEELPEEPGLVEDEDLDEPIDAEIEQPKPALWKRIGKAIRNAVIFLGVLGTAVHTGMIIHKNHSKVEPNQKPEEIVEETETETKEVENKEKQEETKNDTTPAAEEPANNVAPAEEATPAPAPAPEPTEEPMSIRLEPGETVYNTETGVEVGYNGNAAAQNSDGSVTPQEDRDLDYNNDNQAVVTGNDLNRDSSDTPPVIPTTGRTGYEVSEEEAEANMTDEERAIANQQEEEWFRMLEESGLSR